MVVAVKPKDMDLNLLMPDATEKKVIDGVNDEDGALDEAFERAGVES